ncbi:hypothetical protein CHUAL_013966 [Chamberlinius hualienensis]
MNSKLVFVVLLFAFISANCQDVDQFSGDEDKENERFIFLKKKMSCSSCQINFGRIGCCLIKLSCCGYVLPTTPSTSATTTTPPATTTCLRDENGRCTEGRATNPGDGGRP